MSIPETSTCTADRNVSVSQERAMNTEIPSSCSLTVIRHSSSDVSLHPVSFPQVFFSLTACTCPRLHGDYTPEGVVWDPLLAWTMRAYLKLKYLGFSVNLSQL